MPEILFKNFNLADYLSKVADRAFILLVSVPSNQAFPFVKKTF